MARTAMRSIRALVLLLGIGAAAYGAAPQQILLWPGGAPGSEGRTTPETVRISPPDDEVLSNINFPSLAPYLPDPAKATGAAVIVVPGGGHREIWIAHEGYRVAQYLSEHGVAAFVLRYRLSRAEGSSYTIMGHSLPDVQRAIRLVRSRAAEWRIDPSRVGVMGFSAGGQLSALAGTHYDAGDASASDPVDRQGSKPAFLGLIYPYLPDDLAFSSATPPAFLLGGEKDAISKGLPQRYLELEKAGVPAELHMLAGAPHGFGIRQSNPPHVAIWPQLFVNWLEAEGFLKGR